MPNDTPIFIKTIKKILKDHLNPDRLQSVRLKLSSLSSEPEDDFGLSELNNEQQKLLLQRLTELEKARQEEADRENKDFADQYFVPGTRFDRPFKEAEDKISEEYLKQIIVDIQSPSNSPLGVSGVGSASIQDDPPATSVSIQPDQENRNCLSRFCRSLLRL